MAPRWQEKDRIEALKSYDIMDTPREQDFDHIVKLASQICHTPVALISLVGDDRQWFKAAVGTTISETPRDVSFCDKAILQGGVVEVENALEDTRFADNPLVTGDPHIRFYTGAVLETPEGIPLGTLCVIDTKPGKLTEEQKFALRTLADQVMNQLELRRIAREHVEARRFYEAILATTEDFVYVIGLDKRFEFANSALLTMWGRTAENTIGKNFYELNYPEWHAAMHEAEIDTVIATRKPFKGEVPFTGTHGRRIYEYIFSPVFSAEGEIISIAGTTRDTTDRKEMEEALRLSEERRALALHASDFVGTWDWDIVNDKVVADERFARLFSVDPEKAARGAPVGEFMAAIHKDDVPYVTKLIEQAMVPGGDFSAEYRLVQADGAVRWVHATGKIYHDDNGAPVRFPGVAIDITDRKRASDALEEARTLAEAASAAKTEFLTNMSHEIRTPMNAVIGLTNILNMSSPLTEKQKQFLQTLQLSADSLLALINDLLDISKIEARAVELEHIPFSLPAVAEDVISMTGLKAREKSLFFTLEDKSTQGRKFYGDPARLKQIILNLTSNAVKFTNKGVVKIILSNEQPYDADHDIVSIAVQDTGIGIAPEKTATIFDKFTQGDSSINRKYGGTGLGLAITKTLVEIMGGTLSLESALGVGSCFTARIPMKAVKGDMPHISAGGPAAEKNSEGLARRILLVDDYPANVIVAGAFLDRFGLGYDVAMNGDDAVEMFQNESYAVILMDVQMEGMSGFDATALIRGYEKKQGLPRVRIIGMTAHALNGDRERCLEAGMDDYIPKPFNPDLLKAKLDEAMIPAAGSLRQKKA